MATFAKHFDGIRAGLARAATAYNDAMGSYDHSVRPSGERLLKLGADSGGKAFVEAEPLSDALRPAPAVENAAS